MGWASQRAQSFWINLLVHGLSRGYSSFGAYPPAPAGRKIQYILTEKKIHLET